MQTYAAIDLHSNNGVLAVIDETDRVLKQRRIANKIELFVDGARAVSGDVDTGQETRFPAPPGGNSGGTSRGSDPVRRSVGESKRI